VKECEALTKYLSFVISPRATPRCAIVLGVPPQQTTDHPNWYNGLSIPPARKSGIVNSARCYLLIK
jgi:hypothetical protein